jgi:hypothetical protein
LRFTFNFSGMPTNSKQNNSTQDEIDLVTLFVKLGEGIKKAVLWFINFIGTILVFLLRKWYYFLIALILTVVSAYILNNISEPYYTSDLIMRSNATQNQPVMASLEKLDDYASGGNSEALSKELHIGVDEASKLKGIETFWYYDIGGDGIFDGLVTDNNVLADTSVVKIDSVFLLRASVFDPSILKKLEGNLVEYLDSNPFLKALNKQRLSDLEARLEQTKYEIEKLDSLQKREYYTNTDDLRQKEGQIVFTNDKTVRTYHADMFSLLQIEQDCERDLNIYNDVVTVVEGFTVPAKPDNGVMDYAKKLVWFYLGLALLVAVIVTFRKTIWAPLRTS